MAEEEVLQEEKKKPKKEGGGGGMMTIVALVVSAVVIIIATAVLTSRITNKMGGITEEVNKKVSEMKTEQDLSKTIMGEREEIEECKGEVIQVKKDGMIINLADGETFLKTDIYLCVEKEEVPGEKKEKKGGGHGGGGGESPAVEFEKKIMPAARFAINEYLSMKTREDFFPGAGGPKTGQVVAGGGETKEAAALFANEDSKGGFSKSLDTIRGELTAVLQKRASKDIKDVYLSEFLVQ